MEDNVRQLYYDIDKNMMFDEDGFLQFNIFSIITSNMLSLFLKRKEYMCFEVSPGYFVELIYPEDYEELEEDIGYQPVPSFY